MTILAKVNKELKPKENLYQAEYLGSGTFIITKPKRRNRKLQQQRTKSPQIGARK